MNEHGLAFFSGKIACLSSAALKHHTGENRQGKQKSFLAESWAGMKRRVSFSPHYTYGNDYPPRRTRKRATLDCFFFPHSFACASVASSPDYRNPPEFACIPVFSIQGVIHVR
jgi:hypothetical protein